MFAVLEHIAGTQEHIARTQEHIAGTQVLNLTPDDWLNVIYGNKLLCAKLLQSFTRPLFYINFAKHFVFILTQILVGYYGTFRWIKAA